MVKRIISLLLCLICLSSVALVCAYAEGEEELIEEETEMEETEPPTEKPTQPPTEPPKPSAKRLGYAAYAKKLDETVYSESDLGAKYSSDSTTFKVWSPAADDVKVCIYKTGSDDEEGFNTLTVTPMKYSKSVGTWYITLDGDYKNMYYTYKVTIDGETYEVVDPYAKAVGVNGNRGMIVDLDDTDPEGWEDDSFERVDRATDAIVWEVSVRDFSASATSGVSEKNRGKFLAFTEGETTLDSAEGGLPTGIAYLKELGVNYVQINPFYDFASIDEAEPLDGQYNWGYDPKNYNVPEGSYSSDPYDGRVRITECKQMIRALHKAGIGVIMDVVYNHTYDSEESFFNRIAPNYYHRFNEDGSWSNGSGCGNDVATERTMVSKFIRESVKFWADEYHIDGFRFDLMGLMDVNTMNGIRADLDTLPNGEKIIMYGEAWNLKTTVPAGVELAIQDNMYKLDARIGAFNDTGRDAIKGSNFNAKEKGYVQEGTGKSGVKSAVDGDGSGWAKSPNQCVNYASCHDNLTLYDKLTDSVYGDDKYTLRRDDLVAMNKLSASIVLMSRGMPFMLAGEELGRTKKGDENSYISDISVNEIDWKNRFKFTSLTDYYKGLIKIRKAVPALRDPSGDAKITYLEASDKATLAYTVTGEGSPSLAVAFNGSTEKFGTVTLPEGDWVIIADADRAGLKALGTASGSVSVSPSSAVILMDQDSFAALAEDDPECLVYLRYRNKSDHSIICEERLEGTKGDDFIANTPSEILFHYNILNKSALSGSFEKAFELIDAEVEPYEGDYSTVTVKFLSDEGEQLANTLVMTNRVGQQYFTPSIAGVKGWQLDLENLPENGAGLYTGEPVEVIYRYVPAAEIPEDSEYTCRANVIYLADNGTILGSKSYMGVEGDALEIEELAFEGYRYYDESNSNAVFSDTELNVVLYYQSEKPNYLVYAIAAGAAIILLGAAALIFRARSRRRMRAIEIEE